MGSLPAGGRGPGGRTREEGKGADTPAVRSKQCLLGCFFPPFFFPPLSPPQTVWLSQSTRFSWKSPEKKKKEKEKAPQDICRPAFLGLLQPRRQRLAPLRSAGPLPGGGRCLGRGRPAGIGLHPLPVAQTFRRPRASRGAGLVSGAWDRAGGRTAGERPQTACPPACPVGRKRPSIARGRQGWELPSCWAPGWEGPEPSGWGCRETPTHTRHGWWHRCHTRAHSGRGEARRGWASLQGAGVIICYYFKKYFY